MQVTSTEQFRNKTRFEIAARALLIAGGLNWGSVALLKFDVVKWLGDKTSAVYVPRAIYVLVAIAAAWFMTQRDFWLPFLGPTVYPCGALAVTYPGDADTDVVVSGLPGGATVVYWAATPGSGSVVAANPWDAYGTNSNSGVALADPSTGSATLKLRRPGSYAVGMTKRALSPHVHYRVCMSGFGGFMGPVQTIQI